MGKIKRLEISLYNNQTLFFPKQQVQGELTLETTSDTCLSAIRIRIRGRGFVHWTNQQIRGPGEPRFKDTHHHSASEDYLDQTLVLYGEGKEDKPEKCYLPAGRYTYPFRCELPSRLPCSYEGEYGYVRYWVKATIEKGRHIIHKTKVPISILSPLDLNTIVESNRPVQESTVKKLCCFCCLSGPVSATLCLPKRGYVPGEPIRFVAEISNLSSRRMGCCSVELKMTTLYKTDTATRSSTQQICKVKREQKIGKGEEVTWYCDQLIVPPIPPSCLIGCNIISIKYTLELRIDPTGPAFDLTLPIEVIIGTVPHRLSRPDQHHHQTQQYANIPPPRYDRTMMRQANPSGSHRKSPVGPTLPNNQHRQNRHPPSQVSQQSDCASSQRSVLSDRNSDREPARPSSRASSAPSTASTASTACSKRISVTFAEASIRRRKFRYSDHSDDSSSSLKFTPVYPFYQWT